MSCSRWTWSRPYSPPLQWYIYCAVLVPQLCLTYDPMNCSPPDPLSVEFSRQEYWSGLTFPFPWDLLNPRIEPQSPALWVDSLPSEHIYTYIYVCVYVYIYVGVYIYIYAHIHPSWLFHEDLCSCCKFKWQSKVALKRTEIFNEFFVFKLSIKHLFFKIYLFIYL